MADLTELAGMDRSALSKLETGQRPNPTVEALVRYAEAVGKQLIVTLAGAEKGPIDPVRPETHQVSTWRSADTCKWLLLSILRSDCCPTCPPLGDVLEASCSGILVEVMMRGVQLRRKNIARKVRA